MGVINSIKKEGGKFLLYLSPIVLAASLEYLRRSFEPENKSLKDDQEEE